MPTTGRAGRSRPVRTAMLGLLLVLVLLALSVVLLDRRDDSGAPTVATTPFAPTGEQVARGAYLALAGNCAGCHTARGGAAYAGGTGIVTPFGTVFASNLTADPTHGIGAWTSDDFWRALHHGRSRDGRRLYPAFPYPNYTRVSRPDADALFAFLRQTVPVARANTPHALRFPYDQQAALAVWRAVWFRPGEQPPDTTRSADWNRGRYLVNGLGHCSACHAARNAFGASTDPDALGGGLIPLQNWYAPSLQASDEAGVADWPIAEIVALLGSGRSAQAAVSGPMADVVFRSTQHLSDADLRSIATYLKALPAEAVAATRAPAPAPAPPADPASLQRGADIYRQRCADCHGAEGQGAAGAYPALAGNRAVRMASPANLVQLVVHGGYLPSTAGNPRPYGMPPFGAVLDDADIAAVISHLRQAWGPAAPPVSTLDVLRLR